MNLDRGVIVVDITQIREMSRDEMTIAIRFAESEGWNPGIDDANCFYDTDPNGFFAVVLDNEIIGTISAVKYNESFGFVGFYIVKSEYRNDVIGLKLGQKAHIYLGNINFGLDGVVERIEKYKNIGFIYAYPNIRFSVGGLELESNDKLIEANQVDFDLLTKYDTKHFPTQRDKFLKNWINLKHSKSLCKIDGGEILGYGTIRKCFVGYKIGPLFADNYQIADEIFKGLVSYSNKEAVYLDVPEPNKEAILLTEKYNMHKVFETARMYSKEIPKLPLNNIFGNTTFELG